MGKENRKHLVLGLGALVGFICWTVLICYVDMQPIGPQGSKVGFATVNGFFHRLTGVHWWLYTLTDWLSLIPLGIVVGFGLQGLMQWIRRKRLGLVDRRLWILGGFYGAVLSLFFLFEKLVINYRPVLVEGKLEASYPSSTTLLVSCVMLTASAHLSCSIRKICRPLIWGFTGCMVIGRLVCGVHWLTDIFGGVLLSTALIQLHNALK